jgi:hypothetical protein
MHSRIKFRTNCARWATGGGGADDWQAVIEFSRLNSSISIVVRGRDERRTSARPSPQAGPSDERAGLISYGGVLCELGRSRLACATRTETITKFDC